MCLNFVFFRASLYKSTAARKKRKTQMPRNHQVSGHFIKKIKICLQMINKKLFSDITKHNVSLRRGSGALSTVCGAVKLIFTAPVFLVQGSLTSPIFFKQTKQRQTCGEKFFICFAVVPVLSLPLAAASTAQREKRTFSAIIADSKTLSYKVLCPL